MRQLHPDVAENEDGDLFLTRGRHDVFAHATGAVRIPVGMTERFLANLEGRARHCREAGIGYRHVIFPDKQTVLRHRLPDLDIHGIGEEFSAASPGDDLLYLAPLLREAAQTEPVFLTLDTHMTDLGTLEAVRGIVDSVLPGLGSADFDRVRSRIVREVEYSGDLGGKLDPVRTATRVMLKPDWPFRRFHNNYEGGNDGILEIFVSPAAAIDKRLVVFGDSFARSCLLTFSAYFREILFVRTRFFHPEIVDLAAPDVVLTQNVERYLVNVPLDRARPHALLYPALSGKAYDPSTTFAKVLDAFLARRFDPDRLAGVLATVR